MQAMKSPSKTALASLLLALGVLQGCASTATPSTPEDIVRERAGQRWQALIAGNVEKAYSLTAPSYRKVVDLDRYRSRAASAVNRKGVEVVSVTCKPEVCEATVRVDFTPPLRPRELMSTHVVERWVLEGGSWWLHQQP